MVLKAVARAIAVMALLAVPMQADAGLKAVASGGSVPNVSAATGILPVNNGGNIYNAVVTASPYNASGFLAQTTITTSVTAGTTNVLVTSSAGFNVGQVVVFSLGGTSGNKNFAQIISAIPDSTHITVSTASALTGGLLPPSSTSGTAGIQTTINGATYVNTVWSFGTTTLVSSVASGATSLTVANATSYNVGNGIYLPTGGAAGVSMIANITAISGNTITIDTPVANASGIATGTAVQHDDTTAFQKAVNLASVGNTADVYVPDGYYQINGPILDNNSKALVKFPNIDSISGQPQLPETTLHVHGKAPASGLPAYLEVTGAVTAFNGATISTINAGGGTIFGAYDAASYNSGTTIHVSFDNLRFRSTPNPNVSLLDCNNCLYFSGHDMSFDTGDTGPTAQPLNAVAALRTAGAESGGNGNISNLQITGYYYGIVVSEHTTIHDIRMDNVWIGVEFDNVGGNSYGVTAWNLQFNGCPYGLVTENTGGGRFNLNFTMINAEHKTSPSWVVTGADVYDPGNKLTGFLSYDTVAGAFSQVINGANGLHIVQQDASSYPLATQVFADLVNTHFTSAANGVQLYCFDCTPSPICTGGGSGAMATKIGGKWQCTPPMVSQGTTFTTTGCAVSATSGGANAGTYTSGTSGTCTVVITMNGATGLTAPNGWACTANDRTTTTDLIGQTASTTTTATLSGPTVSGDVVSFSCTGY